MNKGQWYKMLCILTAVWFNRISSERKVTVCHSLVYHGLEIQNTSNQFSSISVWGTNTITLWHTNPIAQNKLWSITQIKNTNHHDGNVHVEAAQSLGYCMLSILMKQAEDCMVLFWREDLCRETGVQPGRSAEDGSVALWIALLRLG